MNIGQLPLVALVIACVPGTAWASESRPSFAEIDQDAPAVDQPAVDQGAAAEDGDIVVTARRRDESLISVPVSVSAIGSEELTRRNIATVDNIARVVPSLLVGNSSGGGALSLRGVGAADSNQIADQAVAFNIDGVQIARSIARRLSQLDLVEVQVLKGPQALYFGKNSPAGIIVLRTGDPTASFEGKASIGYEVNASQWRGEAYLSGPITETLGIRVAGSISDMKGYFKNITNPTPLFGPTYRKLPIDREVAGRVTLKFEPSDRFTAQAKLSYSSLENAGNSQTTQRVLCPLGAPIFGAPDDCTANDTILQIDLGPNFHQLDPHFPADGVPYGEQRQFLGSLDMRYDVANTLTLSSLTGYYDSEFERSDVSVAYAPDTAQGLARSLAGFQNWTYKEFSQELRLASDSGGPLNFTIAGFYQRARTYFLSITAQNPGAPTFLATLPSTYIHQNGTTYSGFASLIWSPLETIEVAGGARYSHETKTFKPFRLATGQPFDPSLPDGTLRPRASWDNLSPELTLTWRPHSRFTAFGGFKRGFLSGGFNGGSGNLAADRSFDDQVIEGFEGGVKALAGTVRANLSLFNYNIKGLQVTSFIGNAVQVTNNAASARTKGVEFDANWRTPLAGLTLKGGLAYNDAYYSSYAAAPCFVGQTIAQGCVLSPAAIQNLSGAPLLRAPKWSGSLGAAYETEDARGNVFSLSADSNYTSSFFTDATNSPYSVQPRYWLVDASTSVRMANGVEFALIGRNLTNRYYFIRSTPLSFSGGGSGTAAASPSDTIGDVSRGREIHFRLSYQFGR